VNTKKSNYTVNVAFLDKNGEKHVYQFNRGQDALEGETKFDAPQIEASKEHNDEQVRLQKEKYEESLKN
jgi:hypothetical protein